MGLISFAMIGIIGLAVLAAFFHFLAKLFPGKPEDRKNLKK
jgi:hypothetical protein